MAYKTLIQFGERVKRRRISDRWSPNELARRLNMSVETLYEIERGERDYLSIVEALRIAQVLHISIGELLDRLT